MSTLRPTHRLREAIGLLFELTGVSDADASIHGVMDDIAMELNRLDAGAKESMIEVRVLFVDQYGLEVEPRTTTFLVTVPRVGDILVLFTNEYEVVRVDLEAGAHSVNAHVLAAY